MTKYYTNIQRLSEGYAVRVFEQLWPAPATRRGVARLLAKFITRGAQATPAWSVVLDSDRIALDIGPVQLLHLGADGVSFCVVGDRKMPRPTWVEDVSGRVSFVYKSVKIPSRSLQVSPERLSRLPGHILEAALQYVDAAGSRRRGKSAWAGAHSPGVLAFLDHYLGVVLPAVTHDGKTSDTDTDWRTYLEGEEVQRSITAYERNRAARTACLAHYGYQCAACGVILGEIYGPTAATVIHVHHLYPLGQRRGKHAVHPVRDLRPICPNCHAVAHCAQPPLAIQDVQALLRDSNHRAPTPNPSLQRTNPAHSRGICR